MEDGVFPITSVSPVQSRQKLVRNFSHYNFDGCLLTCMKSVVFIQFLEDKCLLAANATIQCHSWQSQQKSQDWSSTVTLQEVTHVGRVEACWQCEGQGLTLLLLVYWLCEKTFSFYCVALGYSQVTPFLFSSIPFTGNKSPDKALLTCFLWLDTTWPWIHDLAVLPS